MKKLCFRTRLILIYSFNSRLNTQPSPGAMINQLPISTSKKIPTFIFVYTRPKCTALTDEEDHSVSFSNSFRTSTLVHHLPQITDTLRKIKQLNLYHK